MQTKDIFFLDWTPRLVHNGMALVRFVTACGDPDGGMGTTRMSPMESAASMAEWAGPDFAHNLDFIPEDKLNWKPTPTNKSAIEMAQEVVGILVGSAKSLTTGEMDFPQNLPTDRAALQDLIRTGTTDYAAALRTLTPERLGETVTTPFGSFPMAQFATFGLLDIVHHRGQVCYLQMMLGDTENHFLM